MSLFSWFARSPAAGQRRRRRTARPEVELLEDRLTPSVSFNPDSGVLFVQADSPGSNDHVTIQAAGAHGDGSTGVKVMANLLEKPTTFGDAAHPVTQISLDLKDGNDTVEAGDLPAIDWFIGEGNGNDAIHLGKSAAAAVIAGSGSDSILVGDASRDFPFQGRSVYIGVGFGYRFDAAGGSFIGGDIGWGAGWATNAGSNFIKVADSAAGNAWVDVQGTGSNAVLLGDGASDRVDIYGGSGNNAVFLGNGSYDRAFIAGGTGINAIRMGDGAADNVTVGSWGFNAITLGDGTSDQVSALDNGTNLIRIGNGDGASAYLNAYGGTNSNFVTLGDGNGDHVSYDNAAGPSFICLGDGSFDSVTVNGNGSNTIALGNGAQDQVSVNSLIGSIINGTNGTGDNAIRLGNGAGDAVTLVDNNGNNSVVMGNGQGDSVNEYATRIIFIIPPISPPPSPGGPPGSPFPPPPPSPGAPIRPPYFPGPPGPPLPRPVLVNVPFTGNTTVRLGDGAGDTVSLKLGLGDNNVVLGDGNNDSVTIDGTGGTGSNSVRLGNGAGDVVSVLGDGTLQVAVGHGSGASITVAGAGYHDIRAAANDGAVITDTGYGGGLIAAENDATVTVNGVVVTAAGTFDGVFVRLFK